MGMNESEARTGTTINKYSYSSTRNCGLILKLERFSHLSGWSFGLGSLIRLGYLSLVLSLKVDAKREGLPGAPREGPE